MSEGIQPGSSVKVLWRHGESMSNAANSDPNRRRRIGGYQPRIPLSPTGEEQARRRGEIALEQLSSLLEVPQEKLVVVRFSASPAVRAQETARLAMDAMGFGGVPLVTDERLAEIRKGIRMLGGHEKRFRDRVETPGYWTRRKELGWDFRHGTRIGGGQTAREVGEKVHEWFKEKPPTTNEDTEKIIVDMAFGHGIAARYGVGLILGADMRQVEEELVMGNGDGFVLFQKSNRSLAMGGQIRLHNT